MRVCTCVDVSVRVGGGMRGGIGEKTVYVSKLARFFLSLFLFSQAASLDRRSFHQVKVSPSHGSQRSIERCSVVGTPYSV